MHMIPLREGALFINYRRDDSTDFARTLERTLDGAFETKNVAFRDEGDIRLTQDWKQKIWDALRNAEILLAVIGPKWVSSFEKYHADSVAGESKESKTKKNTDWVRTEIEYALREGLDVIPLLLPGVTLPSQDDIPPYFPKSLHGILTRQAFTIEEHREAESLEKLIRSIDQLLGIRAERPSLNVPIPKLEPLASLPLNPEYDGKLWEQNEQDEPLIPAPYLGPTFFQEHHAVLFHGREWEIRQLFHMVRRSQLSLLDGYSGSGKSSLLHAGLLPRMKGLDHWVIWEPIRRKREAGGLHRQLEAFVSKLEIAEGKRGLLILDQVEEMYTDPLKEEEAQEIAAFGRTLDQLLASTPQLHILLAFRSEFKRKIDYGLLGKYVPTHNVGAESMPLLPLSQEGVRAATLGPAKSIFKRKFHLHIHESCVAHIVQDFVGDDFSPYGILLQIQLRQLWDVASNGNNIRRGQPIVFDEDLYTTHRQGDLDRFVDDQLRKISHRYDWGHRIDKGLGLDVLYLFTTEEGTATSYRDDDFAASYQHIEDLSPTELLQAFKRVYLLSEAGTEMGSTRLAHDSLARVIRRKYLNSDYCAQRAWRIVETKEREIRQGFENVSFSESDIASVEEGRYNMRKLPDEVEAIYQAARGTLHPGL